MKRKKYLKNLIAVLSAAFMSFVSILTETSLNTAYPTLMRQFKIDLDTVQWSSTGYLLMISIIMVCSSYLNERYTARQLFIFSCLGFIAGSLVCTFSINFPMLLIGRLISAMGAGLATPMMFNLVVEVMPRPKWGFYMGVASLVIAMAPTLGPAFGGALTYFVNWRAIFWSVIIFALIVFLVGLTSIGKYHEQKSQPFDWLCFISLALALISLTLAINQVSAGWKNIRLWLLLLFSVLMFYLFVRFSKKSAKKLLNLAVFKEKIFVFGAIAYFLLQFINIGTSFVLPNYAQIVNHQTALIGGLILLPGNIIAGLLNPVFGKLYDRVGAKIPLYLGDFLLFAGSALFTIFGRNLNILLMIIFDGILMLGQRLAFSNTLTEALKVESNSLHADATAVCQTSQQLAGSLGTTILAAIIAIGQKTPGLNYSAATALGSQAAFALTAILGIIILICYLCMFFEEKKTVKRN